MSEKLIGNDGIEDIDFVDIQGTAEDLSDIQKDIDSQMNRIFEEFGGDDRDAEFKIHVKRAIPGKGELEHCFSCLPAELPIIDRIQDNYGPGSYQVWIYKDGRIFRRRNLSIAKAIKKDSERRQGAHQEGNMAELINAMADNQRKTIEQMQLIMLQNQRPSVDIPALVGAIVPVIGLIKDIIPPRQNEMDSFIKAASFMKEVTQPEDKESNFFDMVGSLAKSFGPGIMELSQKMPHAPIDQPARNGEQPINQNPIHNDSLPNPQATKMNTSNNPQPENDLFSDRNINALRQQLGMLVMMASVNKDPLLYADLVMDQLPEEYIRAYILRPDWIDFLIKVEPKVASYPGWFTEMHAAIENVFSQDELTETETAPNNIREAVTIPSREPLEKEKPEPCADNETSSKPAVDSS